VTSARRLNSNVIRFKSLIYLVHSIIALALLMLTVFLSEVNADLARSLVVYRHERVSRLSLVSDSVNDRSGPLEIVTAGLPISSLIEDEDIKSSCHIKSIFKLSNCAERKD
jgi:hypothetical protein